MFFNKLKIKLLQGLLYCLDKDHRTNEVINPDNMKKFTHMQECNYKGDFGVIKNVFRTVPYEVWKLETETRTLLAADKHRVLRHDYSLAWIEELSPGDRILTENGIEYVKSCKSLGIQVHMYSLETESEDESVNHLYYANGILSHNTTCAAAFILWKAMFEADSTILIAANKFVQAIEIMDKIKFGYENLEGVNWLRAGIVEYNKQTITFDNGSRIISRATSSDAGRGLAISLLYCLAGDTLVTVRNKETQEIKDISLMDLYTELLTNTPDDVCFIAMK